MDDETIKLGVDATPQFIGALTEMVWAQIGIFDYPWAQFQLRVKSELTSISETVGQDLEAFAK